MSPGSQSAAEDPAPRARRTASPALVAVLALLILWGGWFIYRTSFEVDGERYFVLFDDAMISMTYARNLVEGHGLRWAREGAPVEGFTTPLWTFLMVPINALPLPLRDRSLPVQALSLLLLALNLVVVKRLSERFFSAERGAWLPAVLLTAFYYPLDYWALMGMETGLQALLTTLGVLLTYEIVAGRGSRIPALSLVLAAAYLTRMDMALLLVAVLGFLLVHGGFRREDRARWLVAAGVILAAVLGYQLFRVLYFGAPLPNTYYLKLTGIPLEVRLLRGLATYADFFRRHSLVILPVLLGAAPLWRKRREVQLPLVLFGLYSLYSIYVGGDAWEHVPALRANRFVAFVLPLLFLVVAGLLDELRAAVSRASAARHSRGAQVVTLAATAFLLLAANGLGPGEGSRERWWDLAVAARPTLVPSHQIVLRELKKLEGVLAPGSRVATFWAGVPAFFSDYRMVDMYGYSDAHVARLPSARVLGVNDFMSYRPGHEKWDYGYVLRDKPPDAFLQVWNLGREAQKELMRSHGYRQVKGLWIRQGAQRSDRDAVR